MQVEFDVQIDTGAIFDYMIKQAYSGTPGIAAAAAGAVLLLLFGRTGNAFCLAAGLIVLAGFPALLYRKAKRREKDPDFGGSVHYRLTEEGMEAVRPGKRDFRKWEEVERAVSTTKSVLVLLPGSDACIFPREQLKDSLIPAVEMISTHVPAKKVNIRM